MRLSVSTRIGPFRVGGSVSRRGRARVFAGTGIGRFWASVSTPVGQPKRRRRRR